MKKIFVLMAIAATVLASCSKDNKGGKKPGKDDDNTEYVAPIKIDGNFEDWAKLDATKVATATCDPEATKTALKVVKVYADEVYVFVYFEWDKDQISFEKDVEHVPFHVYINGDGNAATGGFGDQWSDACTDVMFEGFIYPDGVLGSYEPDIFKWVGATNGTGWENCWEGLGAISGITEGAGIEGKYEFQITRELYPLGKLADNFSIGFDIQQAWDSVGILPNAHVEEGVEGSTGLAASLQVTTVK